MDCSRWLRFAWMAVLRTKQTFSFPASLTQHSFARAAQSFRRRSNFHKTGHCIGSREVETKTRRHAKSVKDNDTSSLQTHQSAEAVTIHAKPYYGISRGTGVCGSC